MRIYSIRLINFRNYEDATFTFSPHITVLGSKNGIGKTNILEGIYMASVGKSHRISDDTTMIRFGQMEGSVTLDFEKNEVPHKLFIKIPREGRKSITLNDNRLMQKELIGTIQTVLFSPDDLQIIKGSPQGRRHFLDLEISQTSAAYYQQFITYQKALKQRNSLLKEYAGRSGSIPLDDWDIQLARAASFITKKRLRSLEKMTLLANLMNRKITNGEEDIKLIYEQPYHKNYDDQGKLIPGKGPYLVSEEDFYKALKERESLDRIRLTTSVGPHRDDFIFKSNFGNLKYYGSQGQQRTAALALKLSELEFIKSEVGEYPILLLDDVLSELDKERRANLIQFIQGRIQTFITTTDVEDFKNIKDVEIIDIKDWWDTHKGLGGKDHE